MCIRATATRSSTGTCARARTRGCALQGGRHFGLLVRHLEHGPRQRGLRMGVRWHVRGRVRRRVGGGVRGRMQRGRHFGRDHRSAQQVARRHTACGCAHATARHGACIHYIARLHHRSTSTRGASRDAQERGGTGAANSSALEDGSAEGIVGPNRSAVLDWACDTAQ